MIGELSTLKNAQGLSSAQRDVLDELCAVYGNVTERNRTLDEYYDGTIRVPELGLKVNRDDFTSARSAIACYWPEKVVDALADRIRLRAVDDGADGGPSLATTCSSGESAPVSQSRGGDAVMPMASESPCR